jgi:hypothetical protein
VVVRTGNALDLFSGKRKSNINEYLLAVVAFAISKEKAPQKLSVNKIASIIAEGIVLLRYTGDVNQLKQVVYLPCKLTRDTVPNQLCISEPTPLLVKVTRIPLGEYSRGMFTLFRKHGQMIPEPKPSDMYTEVLYPSQLSYFSLVRISCISII